MSQSSGGNGLPDAGSSSPARTRVVAVAEAEVGQQDPNKYWNEVLPPAQQNTGFSGAWCGGFALWCLHQAGLARGINWEIGKGFCYQLPRTISPQPGDIAYIDQPFQHHAIVAKVGAELVTTIDGNQAGNTVRVVTRERSKITAFFSIAPLLSEGLA